MELKTKLETGGKTFPLQVECEVEEAPRLKRVLASLVRLARVVDVDDLEKISNKVKEDPKLIKKALKFI